MGSKSIKVPPAMARVVSLNPLMKAAFAVPACAKKSCANQIKRKFVLPLYGT
jgi:hypothetical protein